MGRRSINTTKSGKYMNPTDQARKEARKKELKKNKKQRQMVRAAVLKGKDPAQLIEEMEKIDEMEYNVLQPSPLNEKVLKEKRKKLKETFDRVMRLYHNDDPELWAELKRKEVEYEKRRNKKVQYYESVRHAQTVQVDEIPLPATILNEPSPNVFNITGRIPLPTIPVPTTTATSTTTTTTAATTTTTITTTTTATTTTTTIPPLLLPQSNGAKKKPKEIIVECSNIEDNIFNQPPGVPPMAPPNLLEMHELSSDYEDNMEHFLNKQHQKFDTDLSNDNYDDDNSYNDDIDDDNNDDRYNDDHDDDDIYDIVNNNNNNTVEKYDIDNVISQPKIKRFKLSDGNIQNQNNTSNSLDGNETDVVKPTSLQQRMLAISGQNIDEFMKEMENVHKKKEKERAADLQERLSGLEQIGSGGGDLTDDDDNKSDASYCSDDCCSCNSSCDGNESDGSGGAIAVFGDIIARSLINNNNSGNDSHSDRDHGIGISNHKNINNNNRQSESDDDDSEDDINATINNLIGQRKDNLSAITVAHITTAPTTTTTNIASEIQQQQPSNLATVQQQFINLPNGPPPPPVGMPPNLMYRPPPPPMRTSGIGIGIRMPPGPPPGRPGNVPMTQRLGIRMPPGPPPGMPPSRLMHNNQHNKSNSIITGNTLSAAPLLTKDTKGLTTIIAKPQIRNLSADVTRFVPSALRIKRDDKKQQHHHQQYQKPKPFIQDTKHQDTPKGTTKDDAYMQFMKEMQGLL